MLLRWRIDRAMHIALRRHSVDVLKHMLMSPTRLDASIVAAPGVSSASSRGITSLPSMANPSPGADDVRRSARQKSNRRSRSQYRGSTQGHNVDNGPAILASNIPSVHSSVCGVAPSTYSEAGCVDGVLDVNARDSRGNTALMVAARDGDEQRVRVLIHDPHSRWASTLGTDGMHGCAYT